MYWIIADYDVQDASNKGNADKSPDKDTMDRAYDMVHAMSMKVNMMCG